MECHTGSTEENENDSYTLPFGGTKQCGPPPVCRVTSDFFVKRILKSIFFTNYEIWNRTIKEFQNKCISKMNKVIEKRFWG